MLLSQPDFAHLGGLPLLLGGDAEDDPSCPAYITTAGHRMGLMELYEECLLWSDSAADGVDPGYTLDAVDVAFGRLTTVAFQEIVVLKGAAWNPGGDPFWGGTCLSGVWVRENSWTPWTARVPPHLFSPPTPRLPIESCSSPPPPPCRRKLQRTKRRCG